MPERHDKRDEPLTMAVYGRSEPSAMADDILAFQAGREAAMAGKPRDARRSNDWLEGYDQVAGELQSGPNRVS